MSEKNKAEPVENIENRLRSRRSAAGLSQGRLAEMAAVTRQAVCAIEAGAYLPTTAVALRLAGALNCRVEELFNLVSSGETIDGELIVSTQAHHADVIPARTRVKVARVGERLVVRPVATLGDVLNYTVPADGLLVGTASAGGRGGAQGRRVRVRLLRDRRAVEREIAVAGCDPAIFLAGEYLRRRGEQTTVVGWTMGSAAAVEALKRREVHVAGLHVVDPKSGESNLPYLRRHLKGEDYTVITFASWEQGILVHSTNPKGIRSVSDLARKDVTVVNREAGAGARLLLDQQLARAGIKAAQLKGYERTVGSHMEVARLVAEDQVDAGLGIRSVAQLLGLDFVPLQEERYDLVVPKPFLSQHPGLGSLLDTIVSRPFRTEIEALGGYDTRETGKVLEL